jgi:hypothetical protein
MRRGPTRPRRLAALLAALAVAAPMLVHAGPVTGAEGHVGAQVRASPIVVTFTLSAASAQVGQTIKAEASIANIGSATLRNVAVELRADRTGLSFKNPIVTIAQLKAGKSTTVGWSVCGRLAGSYLVLARVTESGQPIDSPARLLTVSPGGRRSCP